MGFSIPQAKSLEEQGHLGFFQYFPDLDGKLLQGERFLYEGLAALLHDLRGLACEVERAVSISPEA